MSRPLCILHLEQWLLYRLCPLFIRAYTEKMEKHKAEAHELEKDKPVNQELAKQTKIIEDLNRQSMKPPSHFLICDPCCKTRVFFGGEGMWKKFLEVVFLFRESYSSSSRLTLISLQTGIVDCTSRLWKSLMSSIFSLRIGLSRRPRGSKTYH